MSTACQLLVPAIYPQGIFVCVCVCVYRARSGYLKKFDQTRRWKMVAAWRVAAAEDKRKSESLCSFTVSPCDSVFFFSPSFHVSDFSLPHTYSLLRFFWTKSCKIWSTFDGIANENKKILRWISTSVNMNAWFLFLDLALVVVVVVYCEDRPFCYFGKGRFFNWLIYIYICGLRMGENLEASGAEYEDKAEKKLKSWGILGGKYEDAADLLEKAGNSFKLAKSCKKNPCLLHFTCLFCIRKCFLAIFDNRNSRNVCRSSNFSKFLAILDNRNSRSVCCSRNSLKFLAIFENRIC
jgi:hypothetical protein